MPPRELQGLKDCTGSIYFVQLPLDNRKLQTPLRTKLASCIQVDRV